jgi:hypothetical protein
MPAAKAHSWIFRSRFRASAFGWRSDLPIKHIKEAVAEIKKATRKDKVLGAEGAVIFLEKVSGTPLSTLTARPVPLARRSIAQSKRWCRSLRKPRRATT